MNPLTAMSFIVASAGLASLIFRGRWATAANLIGGGWTVSVGLWRTFDYCWPTHWRLDAIMVGDSVESYGLPNRMAETTALALVFFGFSIVCLRSRRVRDIVLGQIAASVTAGMGLLTLVSYAYDVSSSTRPISSVPMALNTGVLFLLGGAAVIASRPDAGLMTEFASQHFPGVVARRLVVGAILLPGAIGWLRLLGQRVYRYSTETGIALVAVVTTASIILLIWWAAKSLEETDAARRLAERQVRSLSQELQARNEELEAKVEERTQSLRLSQQEILERLARAAAYRDEETGRHTRRMSHYSFVIGRAAGLSPSECEVLRAASPLHDLGKIGIPDAILGKPGKLTPEEFEIVKRHPDIGADLLSGGSTDVIRMAEEIALTHHERWDGTGYPRGLRGEEIPTAGRIVAVADVLDALTSVRPYKEAWPFPKALEEIERQSGCQFDPTIVAACLRIADEIQRIRQEYGDA